ncbi:MAG: LysR family transcriptional regulator [Actinophytocola sp.]|nr:LysR family transcriptional regulator [Actinophytocola sp.]
MHARQLEYFLAVVDHGGVNRAATALHVEPSLSQAIRVLERDLGHDLFHRVGRQLVLTDARRALVGPARDVVRGLRTARASVESVGGLQTGQVEIAAMPSQTVEPLSGLITTFRRKHPHISVRIDAAFTPNEVVDRVRSGTVELGLFGSPHEPTAADVDLLGLGRQRFVLIAPADGPFPPGNPVRHEQLAGQQLIVGQPGTGMRRLVEDIRASGVALSEVVESEHREAILPLVINGVGLAVLDAISARHGVSFGYDEFDWSCERYHSEGAMMPANGLDQIRGHDAIYLGAVGSPGVADHVSLWGLLIPIRRAFRQYVNLRPITVFEGVESPVRTATASTVDLVVVRENVEGEYSEIGGRLNTGHPSELAIQEAVFTREGVTRVNDYAFTLASQRRGYLTSATKSNGIMHTLPFWDQLVAERAPRHSGVSWDQEHIDALCAKLVLDPSRFDVIVASNLFGDILSDLAAAVAGSIGMAPAANINPQRDFPSMFEPVHGSAPDIAGTGKANPLGAIWTAAMMLDHLDHGEAAAEVETATATLLRESPLRTPDLGGTATTEEFTKALLGFLPR